MINTVYLKHPMVALSFKTYAEFAPTATIWQTLLGFI